MKVGIVGNEGAKFTPTTEEAARRLIRLLLAAPEAVLVSGHCHLGGIDIWAEEEAEALGRDTIIYPPENLRWVPRGYRERNIRIARDSDTLANIVVAEYPPDYAGMRFESCYHCKDRRPNPVPHVKSGGCWTARRARSMGKQALWYVISADGKAVADASW